MVSSTSTYQWNVPGFGEVLCHENYIILIFKLYVASSYPYNYCLSQ